MPYKIFTLRERPDREDDFEQLSDASWPRFLRQKDALGYGQYWPRLFTTWADWQLLIVDELGPTIAATHAVPLVWSGGADDLPSSIADILGRAHGLRALIAPVRPANKSAYPLAPIDRYARWTNEDGLPLDPWIRVHVRLGAEILGMASRALVIVGTVADWERWTDMRFPDSGSYVVPGALQPVVIDRQADEGRYEDPNVWMRHAID